MSKTESIIGPDTFVITHIPVKQLSVVWVEAQRPYDEKWADYIASNFDPDKFEAIIVTKPNGEGIYHIIEGQHRRHGLEKYAAKLNKNGYGGDEQAPCRIVDEADPARAAEIWLGINKGRKAIRPVAEFKVAVVAKREPEVAINKLVIRNGYKISEVSRDNCIGAVKALKKVFMRHGEMTLGNVLRCLRDIWGSDPAATNTALITGFGAFLHEHSMHLDNKRLHNIISNKYTPWKFLDAAKVWRESTQETLDTAIGELLFRNYNKGLRDDRKLRRKKI